MYDPFLYTLPLGTNLYFGAAEYPNKKVSLEQVHHKKAVLGAGQVVLGVLECPGKSNLLSACLLIC